MSRRTSHSAADAAGQDRERRAERALDTALAINWLRLSGAYHTDEDIRSALNLTEKDFYQGRALLARLAPTR